PRHPGRHGQVAVARGRCEVAGDLVVVAVAVRSLTPMEENLVGYLLHSLDDETQRLVEQQMKKDPDARERLERLREALDPLSADAAAVEPPPGLWVRTLAHIARDRCRELPPLSERSPFRNLPAAPRSPFSEDGSARPSWRWADVLALAAVVS